MRRAIILILCCCGPSNAMDQEAINRIDYLAARILDNHGDHVAFAPNIDDETFLRRSSLHLMGRIPTMDEQQWFWLQDKEHRRQRYIERLMTSPGHAIVQELWWRNLLRLREPLQRNIPAGPYITWLRSAIRRNMSYDRMVTELLTAQGSYWSPDLGSTGFYLRDTAMPLDHSAAVSQTFLGTHVSCAQCHDHPTESWTRHDVLAFAAFSADGNVGTDRSLFARKELRQASQDMERRQRSAVRRLAQKVGLRVRPPEQAQITLPEDFTGEQGQPGDNIPAQPLFPHAESLRRSPSEDPRQHLAQWVTHPSHPRFTLVVVNRLWSDLMGQGIVHPVDQWPRSDADITPARLALLKELADQLKRLNYQLPAFRARLAMTRSYQQAVIANYQTSHEAWKPGGRLLQRLTAEQLWDSLLTLIIPHLDKRVGRSEAMFNHQRQGMEALISTGASGIITQITSLSDIQQRRKALQQQIKNLSTRQPQIDQKILENAKKKILSSQI